MSHPVRYFLGLDIGQMADPTVLSVLERPYLTSAPPQRWEPPYAIRFLERFELGTKYPAVVKRVLDALSKPPLLPIENAPATLLAIDVGGVGRGVADYLQLELAKAEVEGKARCKLVEVVIVYAHHFERGPDGSWHVPKKELVSTLQMLLQNRRLQFSADLKHGQTLIRELENFKVKITQAMKEKFEAAREGLNDDIVLSCAMAGWIGEEVRKAEIRHALRPKQPPGDPFWFGPPPGYGGM